MSFVKLWGAGFDNSELWNTDPGASQGYDNPDSGYDAEADCDPGGCDNCDGCGLGSFSADVGEDAGE